MTPPLRVYKASAGSGKTFTLATEYIKLLIANPQSYRTTLAVTFTNKATQEMKERIMSQLYGLWKRQEGSMAYMRKICDDLHVEEATVSERAGMSLRMLLHNYNYFRVETIDSFFQSVLRNLARELDLTANLRVELGDKEVEERAVDRLIERLTPDDKEMGWITDYIAANMSEDKGWNVIGNIKSFGKNIFSDVYQKEGDKIMEAADDEEMYERLIGLLRNERQNSKDLMMRRGREFFEIIDKYNLSVEDFSHKERGVAGFFIKLQKGVFSPSIIGIRVLEAQKDADKWVAHAGIGKMRVARKAVGRPAAIISALGVCMAREDIVRIVDEQLVPLLNDAIEDLPRQWRRHQSADMTLSHINQLRLLGSIEKEVRRIDEEESRFLLSHTQQALHSMIDGSDTPFIFEKIGCQLDHIMIDEFQDTSLTQWANFKVLLNECMSHRGNSCLIVGDVKQSIYRWRNGDWRLLANIEGEWDDAQERLSVSSLATNYRSRGNIVAFNNAFFKAAAEKEYERLKESDEQRAAMLREAYADVEQQTSGDKQEGGRVEVTILPAMKKENRQASDDDDDTEQATDTLELIAQKVEALLEAGAMQSDIAILIRENRRVPEIATYLADRLPQVRLVSNEAFRLDASEAVNIMMDALRLLANPADSITRASLTKRYLSVIKGSFDDGDLLPDEEGRRPDLLPEAFSKHTLALRSMPLTELTERLYRIFSLDKIEGQGAYVSAFHDCLGEFLADNAGDISQLLDYWDETMAGKEISCDYPDGIRIMSIHKSKGLEFESVIVPFCDWQLYKDELMWCKSDEEPYNQLPLIPVNYNEKMKDTVFADYYKEETMQLAVDNLNLLYVAFTRAAANLFVICEKKKANFRQQLISDCLEEVAESIGAETKDLCNDGAAETLTFGSIYIARQKEGKPTDNVFMQPSEALDIRVESYEGSIDFRQSNASREFIGGDGDERQQGFIQTGSLLHNVLAQIATVDDIERVVAQMEEEGLTDHDESGTRNLLEMLKERVTSEKARDWFSPRWTLFNECTILSIDPKTGEVVKKRPDRVMYDGKQMVVVDFKFGKQRQEYHQQVGEYMRLIRAMGYEDVKGYLWFVYTNDIVEVNA